MPTFNPESCRFNKTIDILIFSLCASTIAMFSAIILVLVYDPTSLIFLGALLPKQYYSYFPTGIIIVLFHTYFIICGCLNMMFVLGCGLLYALYTTAILTKELDFSKKRYRTLDRLRNSENLQIVYRGFQILNANMLSFVGPVVLVGHGVCAILPMFCNFILIRYWDILDAISITSVSIMGIFPLGFWTLVLQFGKYLFVRGNKTLGSWNRQSWGNLRENKIMKRFGRSCRLVLLRYGNQLVIGRMTQFVFVKAIMRGTFKSLLTIK